MGEAADLILDGTLCEECGVTIDGTAPGHPRLCVACCPLDEDHGMLDEPDDWTLYFDGAAEPNPGIATYGWCIKQGTETIGFGKGKLKEKATNNTAEVSALAFGLKWLVENKMVPNKLTIKGDSQLVINQLLDKWKINHEHLRRGRDFCLKQLKALGCEWTAIWINRERNTEADSLSRLAYEEATGRPFPERRRKAKR